MLFWGCSGVVLGLFWGRFRVLDTPCASRDAVKATLGSFSCWVQWKPSQCPETRERSAKYRSSRTRYFNYGSSRARNRPNRFGPNTRAKRCAGRKGAFGATPKTRFGDARATRVYENAFCRTLFILLGNNPETPYRPKDYTSESYFKNKNAQFGPRWWWGSGSVNGGGGGGRVLGVG